MAWSVEIKDSVLGDLRWFGKRDARLLLKAAVASLEGDPVAESRNLKTLRPNPVAQRELRLLGRYRVLFDVDADTSLVTIVLVGEKRGRALIVRRRRFEAHESDPSE